MSRRVLFCSLSISKESAALLVGKVFISGRASVCGFLAEAFARPYTKQITADMEKEITITVPEEVAEAYEEASTSDRARAQRALAHSLMSREEAAEKLRTILDRMGKTTKKRGLTDEKIEELLHGD